MSEKMEKCDVKIVDGKPVVEYDQCKIKIVNGKAIVECPTAEAVAEAVTALSKGVSVVQVDVKPTVIEKSKTKKA